MNLEDRLGKFIVNALREEPVKIYSSLKENALDNHIPTHYNEELKKESMNEFQFFQSLNESQLKILDKLIINILDNAAFSFLRETQEAMDECLGTEKINLTIENKRSTELELLSGSLFGEYLLWVEKFSKHGDVQF